MASAMQSAITSLTSDVTSYAPIIFGLVAAIAGITFAIKFFRKNAK